MAVTRKNYWRGVAASPPADGYFGAPITVDTGTLRNGRSTLKVTTNSSVNKQGLIFRPDQGITGGVGTQVAATFDILAPSGVRVYFGAREEGSYEGYSQWIDGTGAWQTATVAYTTTSTNTFAFQAVASTIPDGTVPSGTVFWVSQPLLERRATSSGSYFDGASPLAGGYGYEWAGAPNASTSTEFTAVPASGATHPLPQPLRYETPKTATGQGTARSITLSRPTPTGEKRVTRSGATRTLAHARGVAAGRKRGVGVGATTVRSFLLSASSGYRPVTGSGLEFTLPQLFKPVPLSMAGARLEWVFESPTFSMPARMAGRGLFSTVPYAMTVWLKGDTWFEGYAPSPRRLAGADRVYPGGRLAPLTDPDRAALIAGGYGDRLTLQET